FEENMAEPNKRVPMNEVERITLLLLHQANNNLSNSEFEQLASLINATNRKTLQESLTFSSIDYDTLIKKVPNLFLPNILKYFYSSCNELIGPVEDINARQNCLIGIYNYLNYKKLLLKYKKYCQIK